MMRRSLTAWSCWVLLGTVLAAGEADARREALLQVSQGQLPTDIGSDGLTKFSLEKQPELGGQALKVVYAAGDSVGDRVARVENWKQFITLELDALNPGKEDVSLTLTVKHARTTGYQSRVDAPVVLKPGKNSVRLGIDELQNVNGSQPDLTKVQRWYIACESGETPTVYFGDIWLVGADATAPLAAPSAPAPAAAARAYR
ncbi:MAG: hypothetical protein WBF17_00670, partial [Phycisphaerae bacterium]